MTEQKCEIGMVGLGVMGCNLLLNMVDHGFTVAGYDKDISKVESLRKQATSDAIQALPDIKDFIDVLRPPRAIMMLVPAGAPVDAVIQDLLPHLQKGDLIIDAGNSYFKDTEQRERDLEAKGIQFLGVGISGGEKGARLGPSTMPGGPRAAYERIRTLLEAVSAKVNKEPCVTYLGPGSAGHFVKMVHNGIEYGIMQLIAESYDILKRGLKLTNEELATLYGKWDKENLNGYLMEITSHIFAFEDDKSNSFLVDKIVAIAAQNGTGMWTSKSAMELQVPTPTIDLAVTMRDLSVLVTQRTEADKLYSSSVTAFSGDKQTFIDQLQQALFSSITMAYAQGFALLLVASTQYGYQLNLEAVARIWRGGCIIRSSLLEDIRQAFKAKPELPNLLLDPELAKKMTGNIAGLRQVISQTVNLNIPTPGLSVSLAYFDALVSLWSPANLIQAQRDYFGSHTYQRTDMKGTFHTQWEKY